VHESVDPLYTIHLSLQLLPLSDGIPQRMGHISPAVAERLVSRVFGHWRYPRTPSGRMVPAFCEVLVSRKAAREFPQVREGERATSFLGVDSL